MGMSNCGMERAADGRPVSYLGEVWGRKELERLTAALGGPLPS